MNRTLLLILCDFLLLNLLALTSWERAEPAQATPVPVIPGEGETAGTAEDDLVAMMKLSFEDERAGREQLASQLESTRSILEQREREVAGLENNLAGLQSERTELASSLQQTQQTAAELTRQVEAASRDATMSKERMAQLQRELEEREAEAQRQAAELAALAAAQEEARRRIESLNVAVQVAEQEKGFLRETAETYKQQVEAERQERIRVQETATELAQGVGQLAVQSADLTREIRDNRPVNANILFSEFIANRVQTSFEAVRRAPLGPLNRSSEARTVFVTDGQNTYALLHVDDTPFGPLRETHDWQSIRVTFGKGMYRTTAPALAFLEVDVRIVALPVTAAQVEALGVQVYQLAADPFRFPEAVLISNGGAGYGEVPFRLDPANPSYVRMDNRLVRRLFGEFSPSRGDLVLGKSGELIGIMVNNDYCVIVNSLVPSRTLTTGDTTRQRTEELFSELAARVRSLPGRLQ